MKKTLIYTGIAISIVETAILTRIAWHEIKKNGCARDRYIALMKAAKTDDEKSTIEELYQIERKFKDISKRISRTEKRGKEISEDWFDTANQYYEQFHEMEETLPEELRQISRRF